MTIDPAAAGASSNGAAAFNAAAQFFAVSGIKRMESS